MQIKTPEGDREVASKGVAGAALGLGIAGTVGLLNQWANGGFGCGWGGGFFNRGFNNCGCGAATAVGITDAVANHDTRVIGALNISLVGQAYNEYDVNYLTQYYMADFKSLGQDPVTFICMAIDRLHDIDDPKACEVAYREAMHRIRKHAK